MCGCWRFAVVLISFTDLALDFVPALEDCLHITESGPKFFTPQSPSIEHPV